MGDTGIPKLKVVQTCKYANGKVVEWTQEFDPKIVDRVRATEKRWKENQLTHNGAKAVAELKSAPKLNAVKDGKDEKLAALKKDALITGAASEMELMKIFGSIDTSHNHQVSKTELTEAWPDVKPKIVAALAKTDGLVEGIDHDNDGDFEVDEFWDYANEATSCDNPDHITPQEFNTAIGLCSKSAQAAALLRMPFKGSALKDRMKADPKKLKQVSIELTKIFLQIDVNHDGNLSSKEVAHLFADKENDAYKQIQTYMHMVDNDHDGVVSMDEFMKEADKDGSGTITQMEFCKAMASFASASSGKLADLPSAGTLSSPTKDRPKGPEKRKPTRLNSRTSVTEEPAAAPAKKEEPVAPPRTLTTEEKIAESAKIAAKEGREMTRAEKNGAGTANVNDTMSNLNEMKFDFSFK